MFIKARFWNGSQLNRFSFFVDFFYSFTENGSEAKVGCIFKCQLVRCLRQIRDTIPSFIIFSIFYFKRIFGFGNLHDRGFKLNCFIRFTE
jgi:hypothetical protein